MHLAAQLAAWHGSANCTQLGKEFDEVGLGFIRVERVCGWNRFVDALVLEHLRQAFDDRDAFKRRREVDFDRWAIGTVWVICELVASFDCVHLLAKSSVGVTGCHAGNNPITAQGMVLGTNVHGRLFSGTGIAIAICTSEL